MSLTTKQRQLFWRVFGRAWGACAARTGADQAAHPAKLGEAWRHQVIMEETGQPSLNGLDNEGFERVMARMFQELGDEKGVERFSVGEERRLRWRLDEALAELDQLEPGREHGAAYVGGILRQAGLRELDDLPARDVRKVLAMVRAQVRRLEARMEEAPF